MGPQAFSGILPYDPTTPLGQVRSYLGDFDPTHAVWTNAEITAALNNYDQNNELAAAFLLESAASQAARVAIIQRTAHASTDATKIVKALSDRAARLREISAVPIEFISPVEPVMTGHHHHHHGLSGSNPWDFDLPYGRR